MKVTTSDQSHDCYKENRRRVHKNPLGSPDTYTQPIANYLCTCIGCGREETSDFNTGFGPEKFKWISDSLTEI